MELDLGSIDKEIKEKLPRFLELVEAREKVTEPRTHLRLNYWKISKRLGELQARMDGKTPPDRSRMYINMA